ncbi:hypothetical protein SAMD00019534_063950 [Acytostelium subglobosum LB1]|uniref:hypothetical protein n=1 Tax=Acytostelium subglobosum LB1 TaxID=1410327 RepID=UPI0006448DA6|nr:hypothetical protein SAMD00019534_063950 [Acytostelium subglobosum LB1]GAM23220.1 hypothetical protein SAMD00019534_063950 [Acytostelium subglobosum LB1]|eukprot:XP_012753669.1 hypothetical protein SAMD00019534_063950 [Acytostelium subglobosum LB1]
MQMDSTQQDKHTWTIGVRVRVKTTLSEQYEGVIFNYDPVTTCVTILSEDGSLTYAHSKKHIVRVLLESAITEVTVIGTSNSSNSNNNSNSSGSESPSIMEMTSLPSVNTDATKKRLEKAIEDARKQASKINTGVTPEAQEIFFMLSKAIMPCEWQGKTIVAMNEVKITSPYTVDNCVGGTAGTLERVKSVLDGIRKKLKLK